MNVSFDNLENLSNTKYSLEELLNNLTKNELTDIRKTLDVKGVSKLAKKDLVEVLSNNIQSNLDQIIDKIDFYQYVFLNKYIKESEYISDNLEKCQDELISLRNMGLAFPISSNNENLVVIPQEVEETIKNKVVDNKEFNLGFFISNEVLKAIEVLLHYYGALEIDELYPILNNLSKNLSGGKDIEIEFDKRYLENILSEHNRNYYGIKNKGNAFYSKNVIDLYYVLDGHKRVAYLDYYDLHIDEIRNFNQKEFYIKELKELKKCLNDNLNMSSEKLDKVVLLASYMLKNAFSIDYILDTIKGKVYISDKGLEEKINYCLIEANDRIGKWCLRGYSINEIKKKQKELYNKSYNKQKIGRNDPCPCGSGKKYKKCCMKNKKSDI
ncbi:SEC-C metal-binding domain-containing protein [Clostridium niameyense]|uniref:SEC-C metal-binding domain-containing protein n=1 Tax=Clostridium niameyense TaxID=1622073 RepID=UPI001FAAAF0C|nr:SEC-C metal-binding domain-containing protein [Clostridium niameyense]